MAKPPSAKVIRSIFNLTARKPIRSCSVALKVTIDKLERYDQVDRRDIVLLKVFNNQVLNSSEYLIWRYTQGDYFTLS